MTFDYIDCISYRNNTHICPGCNGPADRDVEKELRGASNFDETTKSHVRYSKAMGVNPEQIAAAEKAFPGSIYVKSGPNAGDLVINNRQHKLQEMKRRGMAETN
jgi:hypothetical protein